jgi:peptidoglycan/xylan/chitin deacetylase (PgdA/CDA1 family)
MFLTGRWVDANPALVRRMVADGHELANHSYSHVDFTQLSETAIAAELDETESAVARVGGAALRPFFRPPFGARNTRVLRVVAAEGYTPVYWTVDSGDWQAGLPAGQVLARVSLAARPGAIVVSHLDSWQTAAILPALIDQLRARGYELVTLSELLGGTFGN